MDVGFLSHQLTCFLLDLLTFLRFGENWIFSCSIIDRKGLHNQGVGAKGGPE